MNLMLFYACSQKSYFFNGFMKTLSSKNEGDDSFGDMSVHLQ